MFIELNGGYDKFFVNTDAIAYFMPSFSRVDGGKEQCTIVFKNPISSRGGNVLVANNTYEEVKRMIKEG